MLLLCANKCDNVTRHQPLNDGCVCVYVLVYVCIYNQQLMVIIILVATGSTSLLQLLSRDQLTWLLKPRQISLSADNLLIYMHIFVLLLCYFYGSYCCCYFDTRFEFVFTAVWTVFWLILLYSTSVLCAVYCRALLAAAVVVVAVVAFSLPELSLLLLPTAYSSAVLLSQRAA